MSKGNVNDTLKLLANNMSKGNLPLSKKMLGLLKQKYPKCREALPETLLNVRSDQLTLSHMMP